MAEAALVSASTLKKRLTEAVSTAFDGVAATAASGSYRSPKHSALLRAIDAMPREGLARVRHLLAFARVAEKERDPVYETAASGSWEPTWRKLTMAMPLNAPEAFLKPATMEKFLTVFSNAEYSA